MPDDKVVNIADHIAYACECGCVRFNLLQSGYIVCHECGGKTARWNNNVVGKEHHAKNKHR